MTFNEIILKHPQLRVLKDSQSFQRLSPERQDYLVRVLEDALFWIELDKKPHSNDGFKFLAATYGLQKAQEEADENKLQGKTREKFIRPHQDLFTMFNPYSGNGQENS